VRRRFQEKERIGLRRNVNHNTGSARANVLRHSVLGQSGLSWAQQPDRERQAHSSVEATRLDVGAYMLRWHHSTLLLGQISVNDSRLCF
jgi:hypothetical protein